MDESGMAEKELRKLERGDVITPLFYTISFSDENDLMYYEGDSFTVEDEPVFADQNMGDGEYTMMFEMVDIQNVSAYSDYVTFYVEGDEITTEVY